MAHDRERRAKHIHVEQQQRGPGDGAEHADVQIAAFLQHAEQVGKLGRRLFPLHTRLVRRG